MYWSGYNALELSNCDHMEEAIQKIDVTFDRQKEQPEYTLQANSSNSFPGAKLRVGSTQWLPPTTLSSMTCGQATGTY